MSKDANLVFFLSVYPLFHSSNSDYDVIFDFCVDSASLATFFKMNYETLLTGGNKEHYLSVEIFSLTSSKCSKIARTLPQLFPPTSKIAQFEKKWININKIIQVGMKYHKKEREK